MIEKPRAKTFIKNPIIGTKFTIAVSSAKGGVGKSTFASNLALALKKQGCKVGLLDADIYGPSLPKLFDIGDKPESDGQKLIPISKYDIQCMSIGFPLSPCLPTSGSSGISPKKSFLNSSAVFLTPPSPNI